MASWMLWMVAAALGAEEPCYGHVYPNRVDSDHFWVEWEDGVIERSQAQAMAETAERSRAAYLALGWPMTDQAVVIGVKKDGDSGMGGIAETSPCDGVPVPRVTLSVGAYTQARAEALVAHEIGHVAQYGFMGAYLDSVASWLWFMEGTASWLEAQVTEDPVAWARTATGYFDSPHLALHAGPPAFLVQERSRHMYGTVALVSFLASEGGGPDLIREMWTWGAERSGEPIFLPDAIEGVGLPFDATWDRWLAAATVVDVPWGENVPRGVAHEVIDALPTSGSGGEVLEGMGLHVLAFPGALDGDGDALKVTFSAGSSVPWRVVLVGTDGALPTNRVVKYVPLQQDDGGALTAWIAGDEQTRAAWLVASPISRNQGPFPFTWTAERVDDPGPHPAETPFRGNAAEGCACATGGTTRAWAALPLLWLFGRRRARSRAGEREPRA